jgi:hypothetical protein
MHHRGKHVVLADESTLEKCQAARSSLGR